MDAKVVCYFGNMNGDLLTRTFVVSDPELAKYQICYFERFIPAFEEMLEGVKQSFKMATLEKIIIVVSCHGYNHYYAYKNNKLAETKLP